MKKYNIFVFLILSLLLSACSEANLNTDNNSKEVVSQDSNSTTLIERPSEEKLIQVKNPVAVDGDTIKGTVQGKEETIRLLLVDTPETVHPSKPVQPFGPEASQFAKDFVKKNKNSLYIELDVEERDKYRRVLGYIWGEREMLNALLVDNGFARVGYVYQSTRHLASLQRLQSEAQQKELGIWSIENYASEEGFNENTGNKDKKEDVVQETPSTSEGTIPDSNGDGKCNDIKGNEGSNGNIYHIPSGQYYERTKAEQYFCTEQEAEAAGFRKSGR